MIAQFVLLTFIVFLIVYAWTQRARSKLVANSVMLICVIGAGLVIYPDSATNLAQAVGIGRGADLITYLFIVIVMVAIFNLHLSTRSEQRRLTKLVREIALLTAQQPKP